MGNIGEIGEECPGKEEAGEGEVVMGRGGPGEPPHQPEVGQVHQLQEHDGAGCGGQGSLPQHWPPIENQHDSKEAKGRWETRDERKETPEFIVVFFLLLIKS